jgi:hypothetical protein
MGRLIGMLIRVGIVILAFYLFVLDVKARHDEDQSRKQLQELVKKHGS